MINIQKHIISEAFEQLSKSAKLNESKPTEARIMEPKYRDGDVVFVGDATGYHGTFLINGDFRKIPKELYSNIRRIYKYGNSDKPYYKVEYRIDSDSLFEKDYAEFFNKIIPILRDSGISVLKSAKDITESKLVENDSYSDNDLDVIYGRVIDAYVDDDGIVTQQAYDKVKSWLYKVYPEAADDVMDMLVTDYGYPSNKSFIDESKLTESTEKLSYEDAVEFLRKKGLRCDHKSSLGQAVYDELEDSVKYDESNKPYYTKSILSRIYKNYKDEIGTFTDRIPKSASKYYKKESLLTEAPIDVKDYAAKLRARKAGKGQNPLDKINSQLNPEMSVTDQLQVYFDELVPPSGPAETIAGELVRAIMRILYRDYNDGDLWYTGYGKETCGDSVVYLVDHIESLQRFFDKMIAHQMEDDEYTKALEDVASRVMVYLNEHPELFTTPLDKDSRSGADLESYFDLPTYEFDVDASYEEAYYDVSDEDIDDFIHDIVDSSFSNAHVNRWARDGWTIEDLDKDELEYLEDVWPRWFGDFLSEHEREEEPEEDYEDEDVTAEADWDDSTDSEFDESLSLQKLLYRKLANDPSTNPKTLDELARNKDTRLAVAKNPNTSLETLLRLSKSRDPEVKKAAITGLNSYYYEIADNDNNEFEYTDIDFDDFK